MEDHLLIEKNADIKRASKKKPLNIRTDKMVYRINKLYDVNFPNDYIIDFSPYKVKSFTLETLAEIISVVEARIKKGIRRNFLFYSECVMVMSDNLTVSMTEYIITFYKKNYGINVYITYGELNSHALNFGLYDENKRISNGFFVGEAGTGFMRDSFLLQWFIDKDEITEEDFYCSHEDTNRCKLIVGIGPWDASIAISECNEFLKGAKINEEAIDAVSDVIGELAPNAVEHGNVNCIVDFCYERSESTDGEKLTDISMVIYNFSKKLLWTDLYEKVFVHNDEVTYKKDRINKIRSAWSNHSNYFSKSYSKEDFYNLMAFQKISGRQGDRCDGGLGINTLIQNVQKYSTDDYCYVLSGHDALLMDRDITVPDAEDYVAFNKMQNYVDKIPDSIAVMKTNFYMPGVAYNLTFYFEEI